MNSPFPYLQCCYKMKLYSSRCKANVHKEVGNKVKRILRHLKMVFSLINHRELYSDHSNMEIMGTTNSNQFN